jgi:hypothetical protein
VISYHSRALLSINGGAGLRTTAARKDAASALASWRSVENAYALASLILFTSAAVVVDRKSCRNADENDEQFERHLR